MMSLRNLLDASDNDADSGDPPSSWSRSLLDAFANAEREFWVLTGAAMALDVLLTLYGLELGLRELNPVARSAVETAGAAGLSALKLAAVLVGVACLPLLPRQHRVVVPLALGVPSVAAVTINAILIGTLLL